MLSLYRVLSLAILALSLFQVIDAVEVKRTTNAQRLARGLTPVRPKRLFDPSRKFARDTVSGTPTDPSSPTDTPTDTPTSPTDTPTDTPTTTPTDTPTTTPTDTPTTTPTDTPTSPTTAPTPPPVVFGTIAVVGSGQTPTGSSVIGYIAAGGGLTTDQTGAAHFDVPALGARSELSFQDEPGFVFAAGASSSSSSAETVSASNRNALQLFALNCHTAANAPPTTCATDFGTTVFGETTTFTVDPTTFKIIPSWTNPDGSSSSISWINLGSEMFITANPSGARLTLGGGVIADLYFIPPVPTTTGATTTV